MAKPAEVGATAVRNFLKQSGELPDWDEKFLSASLGVGAADTARVLAAMQMAGYVEPAGRKLWRNTKEGNAMAGVSQAKPIKRATAEQKLVEFLERVSQVKRDTHYLFWVERAVLFGSFLRNEPMVKDLDIALRLAPKEKRKDKHERLMRERAAEAMKSGKKFPSWQEQERWGEQEVLNCLKSKARSITLYEFGDWVLAQPHRDLLKE